MVSIKFSYTDEFNQESGITKTFDDSVFEVETQFELIVNQFKSFMKVCGFSEELVAQIQIIEE